MAIWGFGMPPAGFGALIAQKYAIQGQEANARSNALDAQAKVDNIRAGLLPGETAADIAKTNAETEQTKTTTQFIPGLSKANIYDTLARAQQSLSTANYEDTQAKGMSQLQQTFSPTGLGLL